MSLYFFHFEAVRALPPAAPGLDDDGPGTRGHVDVWIAGDVAIEDAEVRARGVLMGEAWAAQSMPIARGWEPDRIDELDSEGRMLARQALRRGAASTFVAWTDEESTPSAPPPGQQHGHTRIDTRH